MEFNPINISSIWFHCRKLAHLSSLWYECCINLRCTVSCFHLLIVQATSTAIFGGSEALFHHKWRCFMKFPGSKLQLLVLICSVISLLSWHIVPSPIHHRCQHIIPLLLIFPLFPPFSLPSFLQWVFRNELLKFHQYFAIFQQSWMTISSKWSY